MLRLAVLISGSGTNLQSIIDACASGLDAEIAVVVSSRQDAYGLQRADAAGIKTELVLAADHRERPDYDQALMYCIDGYQPDLIVLAGFMRILTSEFVEHYHGRLINIHPSLLPRYRGLNTHQRVIESGDREHGASVHFVTPELDGGPVIAQIKVDVRDDDTSEVLAARVLKREHILYPEVIRWFTLGRLDIRGEAPYLDGEALKTPVILPS